MVATNVSVSSPLVGMASIFGAMVLLGAGIVLIVT